MSDKLSDFYVGTTKYFRVTLYIDDVAQDVHEDTVTLTIKHHKTDEDDDALIQVDADVTSEGMDGVAIFDVTPAETAVATGIHCAEIKWTRNAGQTYVVYLENIKILDRVSDV